MKKHATTGLAGASILAVILRKALCAAFISVLAGAATARAEYPEHLIHGIVPFAPGGTNDIAARLVSPYMSKILGQSVVIENKPGAAGNVGIEALAKSAPDGYTIIFSATASTQNPALYRTLRYDPINDIQPVAVIMESPYAIFVNPHLPVKNLLEIVALARKRPGSLNASAGGIGTRLSVELFKIQNNISIEVIPYNGTGQASLAVATGETQLAITDISGFKPYLDSGKVKMLAVAGEKRLPFFPQVPTTAEVGLPNYKTGTTAAVYAPAKTPAAVVAKLHGIIDSIVVLPEVTEQIHKLGGSPAPKSVEELNQWYRREIALWKDIVAKAKIPYEN